jgi:uncharacterized protein GlcG (DUF336 family)
MAMDITLDKAEALIGACKEKAAEIGVPMTIAVVDRGGNLVALARMDNCLLAALDVAVGKAFTAVAMRMKTGDLAGAVQPGAPLYGLAVAHQPRNLVTISGGVPVAADGEVAGGLGVSGGSPDQDGIVADAALGVMK